jgi:hypothetical protein
MNNESNKDTRTLIQKKADAYWVLGVKIHISLNNSNWKRGIIKEVKDDFFILDESLEGEQPIFFTEIKSIEKYNPKKEDWK